MIAVKNIVMQIYISNHFFWSHNNKQRQRQRDKKSERDSWIRVN